MNLNHIGKTLHAASRTANRVPIVAVEKSKNRFDVLVSNVADHNCTQTYCINMDTTKYPIESLLQIFSTKINRNILGFHRIILDPPCSGFGKRPDLRPEFPKADYFLLQRKLLLIAWDLLLPNGLLIYSTCSILPQENEKVLCYLLKRKSNVVIESLIYPDYGVPGIPFEGEQDLIRCRRFLPPYCDTVGFFIAKLRKSC